MKSLFLLLSFVFLSQLGYSQNDTIIYYKANNKPALGKEDAIRYVKIKKKKGNHYKILSWNKGMSEWSKSKYTLVAHIQNDSLVEMFNLFKRKHYVRKYKQVGSYFYIKEYDEKGHLRIEGLSKSVVYMHWEGQVKEYYSTGQLKSLSWYKNNQIQSNKNWLKNGDTYVDDIFVHVDIMPEFPGGIYRLKSYLSNNIKYPQAAINNKIQGRVFVDFIVDTDGKVIGTKLRKAIHPLLNKEALRIVSKMPQWRAGKLDGKSVRVSFTVPINFRLK